jgi:hypothetical protein
VADQKIQVLRTEDLRRPPVRLFTRETAIDKFARQKIAGILVIQ